MIYTWECTTRLLLGSLYVRDFKSNSTEIWLGALTDNLHIAWEIHQKTRILSSGRILTSNPIQSNWSLGDLVSTWLMLPIIYGGHRIWFFWQYKQFFVHIEVNLNSLLRAPLQIFQHNKKLNRILTRSTTY